MKTNKYSAVRATGHVALMMALSLSAAWMIVASPATAASVGDSAQAGGNLVAPDPKAAAV